MESIHACTVRNARLRQIYQSLSLEKISLSDFPYVALKHFTEIGCPAILVYNNLLFLTFLTGTTQAVPELSSLNSAHCFIKSDL